ncbi:minor capsid protein [Brevibacillus laterosporus]|uniref:Minor capsid protein n=1 Tax=Brevibacillus laterosporus TaxID=1465 RepID=A0AAP3GCW6_BRELA|nr:minor capsid protein [Brevibacillus laterosporus]MCR8983266.1 minor capsid protein [Brevibacillus laterosporus]MCZ0810422.1 minor capsid protein [Brevibacillus laterosporus]MCZ0829005.1 minor capsid protein [Brevibacillus laterosporus]MCZ0853056.1 minor capsid protein [Brevibacillus laterosporus]
MKKRKQPPRSYWQKRSEQVAQLSFDEADKYAEQLRKEYDRAIASIKRDIEVFYQRFANNNEIDLADARKLLTGSEMKEFKMTLEEFTAKAKGNLDGRWTKELNNVYYKTRVSRLEALLVQIRQSVEELTAKQERGTKGLLRGNYTDTYYRTVFEIQKGTGVGVSFARVDKESLEKTLQINWKDGNYSERIWSNRDKLLSEVQTLLSQSFIRGDSSDKTAKALSDRMDVSYSHAARIVRTESSYITHQATMDGYKSSGVVQKYEFLAALDSRTSNVCRGMDGKVFKLSEQEVGVNFPPLHPNCRSTTVAYFDDEIDVGERFARDQEGNAYYVPGDMTYTQWQEKYVNK